MLDMHVIEEHLSYWVVGKVDMVGHGQFQNALSMNSYFDTSLLTDKLLYAALQIKNSTRESTAYNSFLQYYTRDERDGS